MPVRTAMNVSLTPELEQFVRVLVRSGRYHSASEVVRDGLRLLGQSERRRLVEKAILEGLNPEEEAQLPPDLLRRDSRRGSRKNPGRTRSLESADAVDGDEFFSRWRKGLATEDSSS